MVLAVAQLHEALGDDRVEPITGGAIEADPIHRHGVDLAGGAPESRLEAIPERGVAEPREDEGETVVGKVEFADGLSGTGFEGALEFFDPVADVDFAVIGVREDIGDPDGDDPPLGESLMKGMGDEDLVEELRETELDEEADEQGDIVDAFMSQLQ
jgi:hypothetical protein